MDSTPDPKPLLDFLKACRVLANATNALATSKLRLPAGLVRRITRMILLLNELAVYVNRTTTPRAPPK
jgi:hypothetical protein